MAGTVKANQITLGDSVTDTQNFALKTNVDGSMKLARKSDASGGDIITVDSSGNVKIIGMTAQAVHSQTGVMATGTTIIPGDNTIPQNTEGDQYMTATITPKSASNKLLIEIVANTGNSISGAWVIGALFQDSTANALAACAMANSATSAVQQLVIRHEMTAGTTSATTFKFRAGGSSAGTTTFNGQGGAQLFGGVAASSIRITEIWQ